VNKFQLTVGGMGDITVVTEPSRGNGVVSRAMSGGAGGIEDDRAEQRYSKVSMNVLPEIPTEIPTEFPTGVSISDYLDDPQNLEAESWHHLGLLLSCYLAEIHSGKILMQGSKESGYGYVVTLPQSQLN
jgi:hypothetical protein